MGETLVRFDGVQELIIDKLTGLGIYKTKSEVIRAGILELGKEYNVLKSTDAMEKELVALKLVKEEKEMKEKGLKYLSEKEVKKKYGFK
ncbi:MAG: hypothetical protein ABIA76_02980 [Candidatus Diapherotrites archaeon]